LDGSVTLQILVIAGGDVLAYDRKHGLHSEPFGRLGSGVMWIPASSGSTRAPWTSVSRICAGQVSTGHQPADHAGWVGLPVWVQFPHGGLRWGGAGDYGLVSVLTSLAGGLAAVSFLSGAAGTGARLPLR
jgi:hypothetical protein